MHAPTPLDLAEAQLQQELRGMFAVDTQQYLESYFTIVAVLAEPTWNAQIQELYRCIHTIKGGAVTVGADPVLYVSAALEDLLSDLRCLQDAPLLGDGQLVQILTEAGELLTASLSLESVGEAAIADTLASTEKLVALHEQVKQQYLPEWNESQQLFQDFADQGFDLVVLDLELAIERLSGAVTVPLTTVASATATLSQLLQIGQDLEFADGWAESLQEGQKLLLSQDVELWRSTWPIYLRALKELARRGGQPIPDMPPVDLGDQVDLLSSEVLLDAIMPVDPPEFLESEMSLESDSGLDFLNLDFLALEMPESPATEPGTESDFFRLIEQQESESQPVTELDLFSLMAEMPDSVSLNDSFSLTDIEDPAASPAVEADTSADFLSWLETESEPTSESDAQTPPSPQDAAAEDAPAIPAPAPATTISVQIPVPLERLNRSAQYLIQTLLAARSTQGGHEKLLSQLNQLIQLSQNSVELIGELRQLQDSYALVNPNTNEQGNNDGNPHLERYRQGYLTINRLLESSLRLSELGAEAATIAQVTTNSLELLDRNLIGLQQSIDESRLVPFRNLSIRARGILRDLTNRLGKSAQLVLQGESLELDAGTLQALEPVLLHLLRNACDHGLESTEQRLAAGKPAQSTIKLSLRRRGDSYLLEVGDDGAGIDARKISDIATAKGLPLTKTHTPEKLLAVICQPGFSAQTSVSDISGRGVGMDVVATQIASLGGQLSLTTQVGVGTTFTMQLPVPRLLVRCVLLRAGGLTFALPADEIVTTTLASGLSMVPIAQPLWGGYSWHVEEGKNRAPGLDLYEYWHPQKNARPLQDTAIGLRIQSLTGKVKHPAWLLADDLVGQIDLLIEHLPQPLIAPQGLMGVSLQADGQLVPVLDASLLLERLYGSPPDRTSKAAQTSIGEVSPTSTYNESAPTIRILVVDDAALVRRRIEVSLSNAGYIVHTCSDGLEAWQWLQAQAQTQMQPALMITDIEMPNMDGFTLVNRCRSAGINMPVLVSSSRVSPEWEREARRLGATEYLTKGFTTPQLLEKVEQLISSNVFV